MNKVTKIPPLPPVDVEPQTVGMSREQWLRTIRLGFRSLWLHRLRSLLTVLGIVFGVCSVIAMLAIGEGASYEAQEQIKNLGSQNIILTSVKPQDEQKNNQTRSFAVNYGINYNDIKRIRSTIPGVTVVVPGRIIREYAWNLGRRADCEFIGTVPWYPEMRNHPVAEGRFFTEKEVEDETSVCVLSSEIVRTLFPIESPIGKTIRAGSDYYRIVGVMAPKGKPQADSSAVSRPGGMLNQIYLPLSTARIRFGETIVKRRSGSTEAETVELHEVTVKVDNREDVVPVSQTIKELMDRNHKKEDYKMTVPLELLKEAERTKRIYNIVLGSIAAISLLVGGIGIMNIMLASVTERTREIGIRRALGAKRMDIIIQFLVETVILSATGGVIGVGLGITIPFMVTYFAEMKTIVTLWSPLMAFSISALVGVVFGLYPALRASRMHPVEALRHE